MFWTRERSGAASRGACALMGRSVRERTAVAGARHSPTDVRQRVRVCCVCVRVLCVMWAGRNRMVVLCSITG